MAKTATLKIYGDIGESDEFAEFFGITDMISAKSVSEFLEQNADATDITVRINSRGGDVQEGWNIHDLLVNSGKKIKTIGEGKVYSIATIVFLAGTEREMFANADGLIHNPYIPPYTLAEKYESDDLTAIAESLAQEEEKILDFYATKTGADKSKLAEYMKNETKLSAEDMVTLGFATKITEPIKAYAYIKPIKNKSIMTPEQEATFFEKVGTVVANAINALGLSRLPAATNMVLTDKDGNELTLEKETGDPVVGDNATPDGTFVMEDGRTIIVSGGKITEITAATETELDKANAEIERLKGELSAATAAKGAAETAKATAEAAVAAIETERSELATKKAEAQALVDELSGLKNQWKPDGRNNNKNSVKKGVVNGIDLDRVDEIREINKTKK